MAARGSHMSGRHKSGSRRRGPRPDSAVSGIVDLPDLTYYVMSEAWEGPADEPSPAGWSRDRIGDLDRRDPGIRYHRSDVLAARKIAPGALRDSYGIPEVAFSRREGRGLLLTTMLVA